MSRTRTGKRTRPTTKTAKTSPTPVPALPVRPTGPAEFITEPQIAAAYAAAFASLPRIPITAWQPQPDGTMRAPLGDGAHLTHTPAGPTPFRALTPCPGGAHHDNPITTGTDLEQIAALVEHCTARHGRHRIHPLATAARLTEDTHPLDVTELRDNDQAKEHPHT